MNINKHGDIHSFSFDTFYTFMRWNPSEPCAVHDHIRVRGRQKGLEAERVIGGQKGEEWREVGDSSSAYPNTIPTAPPHVGTTPHRE